MKKVLLFLLVPMIVFSTALLWPRTQSVAADHPRILLTGEVLLLAKDKIKNNDVSWTKLRAACDKFAAATVEYPDGKAYGSTSMIGQGYQGSDYTEPVFDLGICYQVTKASDAEAAKKYAAKGIEILQKMSVSPGIPHAYNPLTDSGYGIRNFGVAMAVGYDWLGEAMTDAQKKQVYTSLNYWITSFEQKGFGYEHPQGNYFAGYYAAKALAALATEGDNPEAGKMWQAWLDKHNTVVQPYYATWMAGGGWPEGWNYGALATQNMLWPVAAAYTAKGIDLTTASAHPFAFLTDQANNLMHFAWPSQKSLDDHGGVYEGDNPTPTNSGLYTFETGLLRLLKKPSAPVFQKFATATRAVSGSAPLWQEFLLWDGTAATADYKNEPLSYVATGMNQASMRSSWNTDAVWASFTSGPYINYPGSGGQSFNQGTLTITEGNTPFLVHPSGALNRNQVAGTKDRSYGNEIYDDAYGSKKRLLANIFYPGKGQLALSPDLKNLTQAPATRLTHFEDGGSYVALQGEHLEAMYPQNTVNTWTRSVVFVRPNVFVVADTTKIPAAHDQFLAFHVAGTPKEIATSVPGARQIEVKNTSGIVGTVTTLLPKTNSVQLKNVFESNKVYRLEVRPANNALAQNWLSTFEVGAGKKVAQTLLSVEGVAGSSGVLLEKTGGATAVIFVGADLSAPLRYTLSSGRTEHVVTGLTPASQYSVEVKNGGVEIVRGSGASASGAGVLHFFTENKAVSFSSTSPLPNTPSVPDPALPSNNLPIPETRPVYHLYNRAYALDFYTASSPERTALLKNKTIWQDKGVVFSTPLPVDCAVGTAIVRRFSLKNGRGFRFVTTAGEVTKLRAATSFKDNGTVFCGADKNAVSVTVPIYRLDRAAGWNTRFTTSLTEYNQLIRSKVWVGKGVALYGFK